MTTYTYTKRAPYVVANGGATTLTDYQVKVAVTYDADMAADFRDLRFGSADGATLYSHWIESKTDSTSAVVWVKVPTLAPGNTTIYMYYGNAVVKSASSGANAFPFFEDTWADISAAPTLGAATKLTLPTPDEQNDTLHPGVVYIPGGWGTDNKPYWMVHTPFTGADEQVENPCICCSDDGITWTDPTGLTNPIAPVPTAGFNSDPTLEYDPDTDRLYAYWRKTDTGPEPDESHIIMAYSTDGVVWRRTSDGVDISTLSDADMTSTLVAFECRIAGVEVSPCVVRKAAGDWWCFTADSPQAATMNYRTSTDGITWGDKTSCVLTQGTYCGTQAADKTVWHMSVIWSPTLGEFLLLGMNTTNACLYAAHSADGINWTWYEWNAYGCGVDLTQWDANNYRPAMVECNGTLTVWPSFLGTSSATHNIGRLAPISMANFLSIVNGNMTEESANVVTTSKQCRYRTVQPTVADSVITLTPDSTASYLGVEHVRAGSYRATNGKMLRTKLQPSSTTYCGIGWGGGRLRTKGNSGGVPEAEISEGYQLIEAVADRMYLRSISDSGAEGALTNEVITSLVGGYSVLELGILPSGVVTPLVNGDVHPAAATSQTLFLDNLKFPYVMQGGSGASPPTLEIDWMLVREWAATEPTVGEAGEEAADSYELPPSGLSAYDTDCETIASGSWADETTWLNGNVPSGAESWTIGHGHIVTVAANATTPSGVGYVYGELNIPDKTFTLAGQLILGDAASVARLTFGNSGVLARDTHKLSLVNCRLSCLADTASTVTITGSGDVEMNRVYTSSQARRRIIFL